jgi:hypothetical protein
LTHRGLLLVAFLGAVGASGLGCGEANMHLFGAYRYDPAEDCLESAAAVDVVAGPDPGVCESVRCWTSPAGEVYVTTTACDAPEGYVEGTDDAEGSTCALALAAHALGEEARCPPPTD